MAVAMAMACAASGIFAAPALAVSRPSLASSPSSGLGKGFPARFGVSRDNSGRRLVVSAAQEENVAPDFSVSRRQAVSLSALSLLLFNADRAQARDIPLFGLRKVQKVEEEVVAEVKELVKEGEAEVQAVSGAVSGVVKGAVAEFSGTPKPSSEGGIPPVVQAGAVAGAEVVAVLIASTVVNGLVSPSK